MSYSYSDLKNAFTDLEQQDDLYRPTCFWNEASNCISEEIREKGIEKFRSLPMALGFFVPTYGTPGNGFTNDQCIGLRQWLAAKSLQKSKPLLALDKFLNGELAALADYRVVQAADDSSRLPHLHTFSESTRGEPIEQFEFEGRRFSRSALNYLLGLVMLKRHLHIGETPKVVMEIGGGFGTLGEILNSSGIQDMRYIDIDIPPTSFVAQWYLQHVVGEHAVSTHAMTRYMAKIEIATLRRISVLCAWQIERLCGQVDLFVNFISFQEMEPHVVSNYLKHVVRLGARWLLMRNMREGKQKRDNVHLAGVETPILGDDYLEMLPGYELVERNVHPFGFLTVDGYHSELLLLRRKS